MGEGGGWWVVGGGRGVNHAGICDGPEVVAFSITMEEESTVTSPLYILSISSIDGSFLQTSNRLVLIIQCC